MAMKTTVRWALATVVGLLLGGQSRAQSTEPADSYWPVFVENAWGLQPGQTLLWTGAEFEEDSGDFPTFKTILQVRRGISRGVLLYAAAELVRFNSGTYTAWGGSNPTFGLQYRLPLPAQDVWGLQLKAELLPAWGGFASEGTSFSSGIDLSRKLGSFGLHFNGIATAGPKDERTVWVSEVDQWRISGGFDWSTKDASWILMMAFVRAQPLWMKPIETSAEIGALRRLSRSWSAGCGAGAGLTLQGQDYIVRFGLRYGVE